MSPEINPAQVTCLLEILTALGVWPDDSWGEVQVITQPSGKGAVAFSLRLVLDDGLLARHVSALAADETLGDAIERIAAAMKDKGLRSIDVVPGEVDTDEEFHTYESVRELMAHSAQPVAPVVH